MDADVMEIAGLMLRFPDDDVLAARDIIAGAAHELAPSASRDLLVPAADWWASLDAEELRTEYVHTFDMSRRTSLDLTYVTYGDRRQRGLALLAFRHRYRDAGAEPQGTELADHLPIVLELAGSGHPIGEEMLRDNLPVIELLRLALEEAGSPFAAVVGAVTVALPPLSDDEQAIVRSLAMEGPPTESIGLEPFAPPEVMPAGDPTAARPMVGGLEAP